MAVVIMLAALLAANFAEGAEDVKQITEHIVSRGSDAEGPSASILDVDWIAGNWRGEGLGGQVQEIWAEPQAGCMMGMFRFSKDGQLKFYEMMAIAEEEGSLIIVAIDPLHSLFSGLPVEVGFISYFSRLHGGPPELAQVFRTLQLLLVQTIGS